MLDTCTRYFSRVSTARVKNAVRMRGIYTRYQNKLDSDREFKSKETESKSWIHYSLMGFEDKCITFNQEKQFYM